MPGNDCEFVLAGNAIKTLHRAVASLAKIGESIGRNVPSRLSSQLARGSAADVSSCSFRRGRDIDRGDPERLGAAHVTTRLLCLAAVS